MIISYTVIMGGRVGGADKQEGEHQWHSMVINLQ